jgi:hypothetical protein
VSPQFCIILKILGTNLAFAVFVGFNIKVLGFVVNLGTVYGGNMFWQSRHLTLSFSDG